MGAALYAVALTVHPDDLLDTRGRPEARTGVLMVDDLVARVEAERPDLPLTLAGSPHTWEALQRRHPQVEVTWLEADAAARAVAELAAVAGHEDRDRAVIVLTDGRPFVSAALLAASLAEGPGLRVSRGSRRGLGLVSVDLETVPAEALLLLGDDDTPWGLERVMAIAQASGCRVEELEECEQIDDVDAAARVLDHHRPGPELREWLEVLASR